MIKPNNHELGEMFNVELKNDDEIIYYGKKLLKMGAKNVLISMAGDGAIFLSENGEDVIANAIASAPIVGILVASLFGLIPNCAGSVIITELYLSNLISFGSMIAGLLVGSGIGILVLFKSNKNTKENIKMQLIISTIFHYKSLALLPQKISVSEIRKFDGRLKRTNKLVYDWVGENSRSIRLFRLMKFHPSFFVIKIFRNS